MYCSKCGSELTRKVEYCTTCGAEIESDEWLEDMVLRAQHNDVSAWEEIYQMTYARAYSTAFQIVKNQDDAMDMLQDAYVSAFKNIGTLKDRSKVSAWINRIVANQCKNWLKKKNRVVFMNDAGEDADGSYEDVLENEHEEFMPEESVDYVATKELMQEILDKLSDEQRLCVLM